MTAKLYSFFSSDSDELYQADVFRALALPKNYGLQFRYPLEMVHPELSKNLNALAGKQGCIFFVGGNDQALPPDKRPYRITPIRDVEVLKAVIDINDTKQVYVYLKLGEFANHDCSQDELRKLAEIDRFVSEIEIAKSSATTWSDRVMSISTAFPPNTLFYGISRLMEGKSRKEPVWDGTLLTSYFPLTEESDYGCEMQFYDASGGQAILKTESLFDNLSLSLPSKFIVGTKVDKLLFHFQSRSLARQKETAAVRFLQKGLSPAYRVDLSFQIKRGYGKAALFGLCTALAAFGLLLGQIASKPIGELNLFSWNGLIGAGAVLSVLVGASLLYHLFNKK